MKLLPGKLIFGDMCVFMQVCMREKEKEGNYSSTLGRQAIHFIRLSKAP